MKRTVVFAACLAVAAPSVLTAQHHADPQAHAEAAAVTRAALDYLEGFYEGDADKIRRGVHPEVTKYGFHRESAAEPYGGDDMSFDDMLAFANRVRESGRTRSADTVKEVILLDILDQTAAVKVVAYWGTDYLQLAKYEGEWKILHVLWQTAPAEH
jgi:hypothetical protein